MTDDRGRAIAHAGDALRHFPIGTHGLVHRVMLSFSRVGYFYEALEARGRLDPGSGTVVWEELPAPTTWGRLTPRVTDPLETIGDAIPPEALAAGLADVEAETRRRRQADMPVQVRDEGRR